MYSQLYYAALCCVQHYSVPALYHMTAIIAQKWLRLLCCDVSSAASIRKLQRKVHAAKLTHALLFASAQDSLQLRGYVHANHAPDPFANAHAAALQPITTAA